MFSDFFSNKRPRNPLCHQAGIPPRKRTAAGLQGGRDFVIPDKKEQAKDASDFELVTWLVIKSDYEREQNTEWKSSWRDDYLKWICGFTNAQGGRLVIGKNDQGQIVGLANAEKLLEELPNKIRDLLGIMVDVNLKTSRGKKWPDGSRRFKRHKQGYNRQPPIKRRQVSP